MGHFGVSVHVGGRKKAKVHHHGDGSGLLGAAISKAVFLTECNDAVSRTRRWMSLPTNFLAIDDSRVFNSGLPGPGPGSRLSCLFPVYAACCTIALDEA